MILREWRRANLNSSAVVSAERGASLADEENYRLVSEEEQLPSTIVALKGENARRALGKIWRSERCGILLSQSGAAFLAVREPEMFARLTKERRVALVEGPISVTFAAVPVARVDLIVTDWEKIAEQIVADLIEKTAWADAKRVLFKAEARLRMSLTDCCHRL